MLSNITSLAFFTDFLRCMTFTFKIEKAFFQPCLLLFFVFCHTLGHYLPHNKTEWRQGKCIATKDHGYSNMSDHDSRSPMHEQPRTWSQIFIIAYDGQTLGISSCPNLHIRRRLSRHFCAMNIHSFVQYICTERTYIDVKSGVSF